MSAILRFVANMPIIELEDIYKRKFQGHEGDIMFRPTEESTLAVDVTITVPMLIANDPEFSRQFESVMNRSILEGVYECGRIAAAIKRTLR